MLTVCDHNHILRRVASLTGKKQIAGTVKRSSHTRRSFLKRTFTQKVKQVPSCAAESFEALLRLYVGNQPVGATIPTEVNRKARTSAAMIGLAISMGATGLLLPQQGDEAMAVEPVTTEPILPSLANESSTIVSPKTVGEPSVVAVVTPVLPVKPEVAKDLKPTQPEVIEHQVREGETLWDLSKSYQVQPEAIAASNDIRPGAVLPVGQMLKIPSVNGIVHEVKPGETIKTVSGSYGVEPTQLQASAPMSAASQLQVGESVTVPGNVNDLLKARQEVALNNLKEQQNRLKDSLAELRSEESTNLSKQATGAKQVAATTESENPVTLPSTVLNSEEPIAQVPSPVGSVSTSPATLPMPAAQIAASPTVEPKASKSRESSVVIPVPTPEMAATPIITTPKASKIRESSVVIPVPTPEIAATPVITTPKAAATPNLTIDPFNNSATAAKPQAPQPVVLQTLAPSAAANLYQVKPGDTLDAIARRHGLSASALSRANGINNPNLISVNQQLKIPSAQPTSGANHSVTLLPGINSQPKSPASRQQSLVAAPTPAIPLSSGQGKPVVPTKPQSQTLPRSVLAQSTPVAKTQSNSPVVVNPQSSQQAESQDNPYMARLRADILKLRADFQQSKDTSQASGTSNVVVPSATTPASRGLSNTAPSARINPEFNPANRRPESLQTDNQKRQQLQATQQGAVTIQVPPPETTTLAAAPAPTEGYNPALRAPVGQTVSPELPPMSAPDMYPPGSSTQTNGYIWPAKGVLTSGYGWRWGRMHKGIDIAAPVGTPIHAAAPGVVVTAGWNSGGYGNLVEIQHPDGTLTLYAHNNRILVRRGQEIAQGQQISEMGSTGFSTGPHLHFEVHPAGRGAINPIALLPRK